MSSHTKGMVLVLFGVLIMSFESPLIKFSNLPALAFSFYFGICLVLSSNVALLFCGKSYFINSYKKETKRVFLLGLLMGGSNLFFVSAIMHTQIANVVFILAISPVASALFAKFFFNSYTPKRIIVLAGIIFIGISIMSYESLLSGNIIGNLLSLGCVCCFSMMFVLLNQYKNVNRISIIGIGGIVICVGALLLGYNIYELITIKSAIVVGFVGLLISPISRYLIGVGGKYILPAELGLLMICESVLAPILAFLILKEIPTIATIIGGIIILGGLLINTILSFKKS